MFLIGDVLLGAVLFDQQARFAEVMSRHSGEEVVSDLQVQAAVDEFDVLGTHYVHRRPELAGRE